MSLLTMNASPSARKVVLVVEDERLVARDLQNTLRKLGYQVPRTVASADDAIAAASESCPDLVLMDIRIKGQRDGVDAARILRRRFDVPIVFLTAHADKETVERARATEPFGYLVKPVNPQALRSTLEVALYKHEMDRRLRERERWYATILGSIGDAVISTDAAAQINYMNPTAELLTGWRAEDAQGKPIASVVQFLGKMTKEPMEHPVERTLRERRTIRVQGVITPQGEDAVVIADSASPVLDAAGALTGAVWVFSDVSEQDRLRRQIEFADRLSSLGMMAAGIAHELNNPLAVLMGTIENLREDVLRHPGEADMAALCERIDHELADALQAAERMRKIVADVRTFGRPATEAVNQADVRHVLEWAIRMSSGERDTRTRVVTDFAETTTAQIDESRMGQVFLNLLVNAAHAMDPARGDLNEIRVGARPDKGGRIVVEIADTGSGMPEAVMGRIFDPFFTTKGSKGTGLGLSICHGVVKAVGGEIAVESEVGKGSVFRITLPAASPKPGAADLPARATSVPRGNILVIDDEPALLDAIARALASAHSVTTRTSAREAIDLLAGDTRFDAILCDLVMPDMDGIEFYERLLATRPDQASRVVFVSGGTLTQRVIDFLRSVPNARIDKPFGLGELRDQIGQLLAGWQANDAA